MNQPEELAPIQKQLTQLQKIYLRNVPSSSRNIPELDESLEEISLTVRQLRDSWMKENERLRDELTEERSKRDKTLKEWSDRYEKIHSRWSDLMIQLKHLQHQKEDIRQERDLLLCETRQSFRKTALIRGGSTSESDRESVRDFFIQIVHEILTAVKNALSAERASIFVYDYPSNELVSLALVPELTDRKEIRVPSSKGIVGDVFTKGRALNILNAYKDNRFYKNIDQKTGFHTRVVLAYPLISKQTGTTIGCIQLINKDTGVFTIEDEARMSQFVYVISRMFDCVQDLYDFGGGGGSVGYGGNENMTDSQTSSLINVKRIGEKETNTATREEIGFLQKHGALIPKYIEEFIHKLHKSWRIAVEESGKYQNKIAKLKQDKIDQENHIIECRRELEKKRLLIESLNKTIVAFSRETLINQAVQMNQESALQGNSRMKQMHKRLQELDESLAENGMSPIHSGKFQSSGGVVNGLASPIAASMGGTNSNERQDGKSSEKNTTTLPQIHQRTPSKSENPYEKSPARMPTSGQNEGALFIEVFENQPVPMLLLSTSYQICACNRKFCRILNYRPRELIGIMLQNILYRIDMDMLPRLLQYDHVDGLSMKKRTKDVINSPNGSTKNVILKMDVQISKVGREGQTFKLTKPSRIVQAPLFVMAFSKSVTV